MPYRSDDDFLAGIVGWIRAALGAEKPVLVELPGPRGDLVRDALGADAERVRFGDMTDDGRNPGRIIPAVLHKFAASHPGRRVAIVAESMWATRSAAEYTACVAHEALVNLALADRPVSVLCPFNVSELPERALIDAERTHRALREGGVRRPSAGYTNPRRVVESLSALEPATPLDAVRLDYTVVGQARHAASEWAMRAGLPEDRLTDVIIAVSEIGGNAMAHAGGSGTLLCWQDGDSLIYEMRDAGHIQDLLAGRLPPTSAQESGRGLLMVNLLCDLVQVKTGPSGTTIRLWMTLPSTRQRARTAL
jgi:anti-sigma regulatory factor (Ser/Thr protein kinase)